MKKVMLVFVIAIFAFSGLTYAQEGSVSSETPEIKAKIESLVSNVEAEKKPLKLNDAINDLIDYHPYYVSASQGTRSDVTVRLIKVYNSLDDSLTNTANKTQIIDFLGTSNVPEAHKFFVSVLENGKELYRTEALRGIYFGLIPGDDIYDEVKSLVARGVIKEEDSLSALYGANRQRALPEIQKFLATTKNPKKFVGIGHLLSAYRDPKLLDVLFQRYDYFKSLPASAWPRGYAPQFCVSMEMLKKYIENEEGVKYKNAVEVFEDRGIFGDEDLPMLQKKLESSNIVTRKTSLDFLTHQLKIGYVTKSKVLSVLKDAETRETNKDLKLKLRSAIERFAPPAGAKK